MTPVFVKGVWRNGSASDSRSEGWEFESLCPHFDRELPGLSRRVSPSFFVASAAVCKDFPQREPQHMMPCATSRICSMGWRLAGLYRIGKLRLATAGHCWSTARPQVTGNNSATGAPWAKKSTTRMWPSLLRL